MAVHITRQGEKFDLEFERGQLLSEILRTAGQRLPSACAGSGACGLCVVRVEEGAVSDPSEIERLKLTPAQIRSGYRYACQTRILGNCRIAAEQLAPITHWRRLSPQEHSRFSPLSHEHGHAAPQSSYGAAVDLGTTQLRLTIWNTGNGQRLGGLIGTNPQSVFGANVLTRLTEASHSPANAEELGKLVRDAIGGALVSLAARKDIRLGSLHTVIIVGNTAMLSLFAGVNHDRLLQPEEWSHGIGCHFENSKAWARDWGLAEDARIEIVQPLGGFVGSDLLANVLAIGLLRAPPGSMLVDFGTNTELALWDGTTLFATSTPGGCSFDGHGVMPAEAGAVYRLTMIDNHPEPAVIGGGPAMGICGSGMVDFIALLREEGKLDRQGRFTQPVEIEGLSVTPTLPGVTLKKRDIDGFQRGKGAMAAAIHFLLRQARMGLQDIAHLYVSGAFGQFLHIDHAQRLGLLPAIPADRIVLAGNAALAGCEHLLFTPDIGQALVDIRAKAAVINLGETLEYEDLFIRNLYLQPMSDAP